MPAEHVTVDRPPHPLVEMTTYELTGYRANLEHEIERLPDHDATRDVLRARLGEVLAEQDERQQIRQANGR